MLHFRVRDYVSVLFYRLIGAAFAEIGRGVRIIWPLRIVGARYCRFEEGSVLQYGAYLAVLPIHTTAPVLRVGARTQIGNHAHIVATHRIEFGNGVLVADRLFIADNGHEFIDPMVPVRDQGLRQLPAVSIGDGSWIGENVCIIGASIGKHCVVGANSVVARDLPDYCVAAGSPAIVLKRYCAATSQWRRTNPVGEFVD